MTLTVDAKNYIARYLGRDDCFASSGIAYTTSTGARLTGSTYEVVLTMSLRGKGPNGETFSSIPDNSMIGDADLRWIGNNAYCFQGSTSGGVFPWAGPSGTTDTGPLEVNIASGSQHPGAGAPDITLDASGAYAFFKSTPRKYVGAGGLVVTNLSGEYFIYLAWVMRLWHGEAGTTCPTVAPAVEDVSRYLGDVADTMDMSIIFFDSNKRDETFGSFDIPQDYTGKKTMCLTLWGNYDKQALIDELVAEGYSESVLW